MLFYIVSNAADVETKYDGLSKSKGETSIKNAGKFYNRSIFLF